MKLIRRFNKGSLILLILSVALASFLGGLSVIISFQSKYLLKTKVESAVVDAQRLVNFDKSITLERALKLYSGNLSYGVFTRNCTPVYITNLLINSQACLNRIHKFNWMDVSGNLTRRRLVLGYSEVFSFEDFWDEYKDILITTAGTYLFFVFFITFLFFRIFIDKPIIKISSAIDDLLISKHFDIHSFKEANRSVLSGLYATVSKLVEEVVRFNREEEKLVLSRQIAHDLRAPLSVIKDIFDTKESTSEIEKMALKRLQEITNGLMPETSDNKSNVINIRSLLNEITFMYPSVSFATVYSVHFKNDLFHLSITEVELFRFLTNIIKNSIEAGSKNIDINLDYTPNFLELSLKDNGSGIKEENVSKILNGQSFKKDGHGLGLSSINATLSRVGGSLAIETSPNAGFKTILRIPVVSQVHPEQYVLIDDDKLIRINWANHAKKAGVNLSCFESVKSFLKNIDTISKESYIYIDSNLKDGEKGEIEAQNIYKEGFTNIYISTGYSKSYFDIQNLPWVKDIVTKAPPF